MILIFFVVLFSLLPFQTLYSEEFEELGEFQGNENITPAEGFSRAIENARRKIIEKAGIDIKDVTILSDFQSQKEVKEYFVNIIRAYSRAVIQDEQVLEKSVNENWLYKVKLKAKIKLIERERSLKLEAGVGKPKVGKVEIPVFNSGEEIQIWANASEKSWFWIFWTDDKDNVMPLYPVEEIKQKEKMSELIFPDSEVKKKFGKLYAEIEDESTHKIEKLFVIATTEDKNLFGLAKIFRERENKMLKEKEKEEKLKIYHIFRALSEMDDWDVSVITYEIRK